MVQINSSQDFLLHSEVDIKCSYTLHQMSMTLLSVGFRQVLPVRRRKRQNKEEMKKNSPMG